MSNLWTTEAVEALISMERYAVLRAIEESKNLSRKVIEKLAKNEKEITKADVQSAIASILDK